MGVDTPKHVVLETKPGQATGDTWYKLSDGYWHLKEYNFACDPILEKALEPTKR